MIQVCLTVYTINFNVNRVMNVDGLPSDDFFSQESHERLCRNPVTITLSTPTETDDDGQCVTIKSYDGQFHNILCIADVQPPTPKRGRLTQQ